MFIYVQKKSSFAIWWVHYNKCTSVENLKAWFLLFWFCSLYGIYRPVWHAHLFFRRSYSGKLWMVCAAKTYTSLEMQSRSSKFCVHTVLCVCSTTQCVLICCTTLGLALCTNLECLVERLWCPMNSMHCI